ncbi:scavenger receptor class F member 2-like isoform X2 [Mya arenaria]|nr:scavenger receptor class F member 2-like isoform X2 [Mya arenaria]
MKKELDVNSLSIVLCVLLTISSTCFGASVTIDGKDVDCALNCTCCKGGVTACANNVCFHGCVEGIYGYRCHHPCRGNCSKCSQESGRKCYTCKETFFDTKSYCNKTCAYQNCRCTKPDGCDSCKAGFYGVSTFCQTHCPLKCGNGVCNDDGSCRNVCVNGNGGQTDMIKECLNCSQNNSICTQCAKGFYPDIHGNCTTCSKTCIDNLCDASSGRCAAGCVEGYWGEQCDERCTILCKTCDRLTGYCNTCVLTSLHGLYCNSTTAASGVSVGITAVIGVIALLVGGMTCALIIAVILKWRRRVKKSNTVVSHEQRPAVTGHSNMGVSTVYDELKKNPDGTTQQDDHQYIMIEANTVQVGHIARGENERNCEDVAGNVYYNVR